MAFHFLKTGAESTKLAQQAKLEALQKKESYNKLFRFSLPEGGEAPITFIDGDLSDNGILEPPRYYEHRIFLSGSWNNYFVCPVKTNPDAGDFCPLCDSKDKSYLASLFTIIDHRQRVSQKGTAYSNTKNLFVAKEKTFGLLYKIAQKRGGLACATFDVTRSTDKDMGVGNQFDFVHKRPLEELKKLYVFERTDPKTNEKHVVSNFVPADYSQEIIYRTGEELCKLGLGKPKTMVTVSSPAGSKVVTSEVDYSSQL